MKPIAVAENVWQITLPTPFAVGPVNTYLIKEDNVLTLVDVGANTEEAETTLKLALKQLNLSIEDIDQVVLTHHHPDHVGGLAYFQHDTKVIGHWRLEPWLSHDQVFLNRYAAFFAELGLSMGVPKSIIEKMPSIEDYMRYAAKHPLSQKVSEGDEIVGLLGWDIIETPGHAQSHIGLIRKSDRLYITGDHLLPHISSNALLEPPYGEESKRPKTFLNYRHSLKKCLEMDIELVLPGHGDAYTNHRELIQERFKRQENRAQDILNIIETDSLTAFEIGKTLFPKVYLKQLDLVLSEVTGYLDWLQDRGDIETINSDGQSLFSAIREGVQ